MKLNSLRKKIDKIDASIIDLLAKRQKVVLSIKGLKKKEGINVLDNKREKEIISLVKKKSAKKKVDKKFAETLFKKIISHSKKLQRK